MPIRNSMQLKKTNDRSVLKYKEWSFHIICDGLYPIRPEKLDSGTLNSKFFGRRKNVHIAVNFLVIQAPSGQSWLVDAGLGNYPSRFFHPQKNNAAPTLSQKLSDLSIMPSQIEAIVITHFHEDHVGGLFDLNLNTADWNKSIFVQRKEWAFRKKRYPEMAVEMQKVMDKIEPNIQQLDGKTELTENISVELTGGHTPGHQVVFFTIDGLKFCYPADIIPTASHVKREYASYNYEPDIFKVARTDLLERAVAENWVVMFDHGPQIRFAVLDKTKENGYITRQF